MPDISVVTGGDTVETFGAYTTGRGRVISYAGPEKIVLFRQLAGVDAEGNPLREEISSVHVRPGVQRWLFIFQRDEGGKYKVSPIPDDLKGFGPGQCRFINFSPYQVAVKMSKETLNIPAHGFSDFSPSQREEGYQETFMVSVTKEGKARRVFEGKLYYSPQLRFLYLLLPDLRGREGSIRFVGIPERIGSDNPLP
ncbi:hypothetical protein H5P28_05280 [Ruficoccus amylovorans]|uniref:Uncharacterized protein n=1 Tax=Ruficoccus amylovorans TaxID=1804625 RepID=A0A842HBM1_9BACT|nr:hypothetical protein [Ruficoccus amylovorans]MBC2593670.1 hypothetical protein [Ruficoccus amylovorans]